MQNAPRGGEHSAILSTFIKLPFVIKVFVLSNFEWPFYIGHLILYIIQSNDLSIDTSSINYIFKPEKDNNKSIRNYPACKAYLFQHSGKSAIIQESNHGSGVFKEPYGWYYVPKSSILLAGTGV